MVNYEKVVKAALKGDESAFAQLYESTQHDMYYIALKYMKNEDDAMDVVQDSYIKAWNIWEPYVIRRIFRPGLGESWQTQPEICLQGRSHCFSPK